MFKISLPFLSLVIRYFFCFLLGVVASLQAQAGFGDGYHITQTAETLKPLHWSFKPYPGQNSLSLYSSVVLNSLSIGVVEGLEIGTIPVYWMLRNPRTDIRNVNLKYQVWSSEKWIVSTGFQNVFIRIKSDPSDSTSQFDSTMNSNTLFIATDWKFAREWKLIYNASVSIVTGSSKSNFGGFTYDSEIFRTSFVDHFLDFNYLRSLSNIWTGGLSRTTEGIFGMTLGEPLWGFGLSHTWNLRGQWLSQINLGTHLKQDGSSKVLFGLTF